MIDLQVYHSATGGKIGCYSISNVRRTSLHITKFVISASYNPSDEHTSAHVQFVDCTTA